MSNLTVERKEKLTSYMDRLTQGMFGLGEEQRTIVGLAIKEATAGPDLWSGRPASLRSLLWEPGIGHISQVFEGKLAPVLPFLLGDEHADLFREMWNRATLYPFSRGYFRRSFRTETESVLHMEQNIRRLCCALRFTAMGFRWQPEAIVSEAADFPYLHDYIACELDRGNAELLNRLRVAVYEDNGTAILTRNMIKGMLMSRQPEAHKLVGELLKAARLQEGLRQAIAECMDETSREGFAYILNVIIREEMGRFSSIVRAFGTWTGLPLEAMKPATARKCLTAAYEFVTDAAKREQGLESEDSQLLYLALWATAFDELALARSRIAALAGPAPTYRKIVALQFLGQCQAPDYEHAAASDYLADANLEVAAWAIPRLYPHIRFDYFGFEPPPQRGNAADADSDRRLFRQLQALLERMPGKELAFAGNGAFAEGVTLTRQAIGDRMLAAAYSCADRELYDKMLDLLDALEPATRAIALKLAVSGSAVNDRRDRVIAMLGDKSGDVRAVAQEAAERLDLTDAELLVVEELLQYKASDIRKTSLRLLLKQPKPQLSACVRRLLADRKEEKRLGGLDLVLTIQADPRYQAIAAACIGMAQTLAEPTSREAILLDRITNADTGLYGPDNGFGLYEPWRKLDWTAPDFVPAPAPASSGGPAGVKDILATDPHRLYELLRQWSDLIADRREYEYEAESHDGSREKVMLGNEFRPFLSYTRRWKEGKPDTLDNYPLPELWRGLCADQMLTASRLTELAYYLLVSEPNPHVGIPLEQFTIAVPLPETANWFDRAAILQFRRLTENLPYKTTIRRILFLLLNERSMRDRFEAAYAVAYAVHESLRSAFAGRAQSLASAEASAGSHGYSRYSQENPTLADVMHVHEIHFWITQAWQTCAFDDDAFGRGFRLLYPFYRNNEQSAPRLLDLRAWARARELGVVDDNEWFAELLGRPESAGHIRDAGNEAFKKTLAGFPHARKQLDRAIQRIVEIELKRGDSDTPVSRLAQQIVRYEGMKHMVQCLLGLGGKDALARSYYYAWGETTKKGMLSHLLKSCHPAEGDDASLLRQLLQGQRVTEQRLIDAAMYAPQWIAIIEAYLGWEGLSSACWYFHAHVNDRVTSEKETMVARYSPLSVEDLREGAFDIDWFTDAYGTIGGKRFKMVYDSAKYISEGANHRRAQVFADAVLGKLDAREIERELSAKRNKNHVLGYALIPLPHQREGKQEEILRRYEKLQQFAKESRQFGGLRRDSEAKLVRLALDNLARNAGYSDVTRLTWRTESEQFKMMSAYFRPAAIEDWEVRLAVDETGKAAIQIGKAGKSVAAVPDKLKKHEYFLRLKELQKSLKDQYGRARESLERAMTAGEPFDFAEIRLLLENEVIAPLLKALVFKAEEGGLGFPTPEGLRDIGGQTVRLAESDRLTVAHPVHLFESGLWPQFQRDLLERRAVQPFKQVFRELYRPNDDERTGASSSRYAGHQLQPRKAAALFKSRQWTVSHGEGLQKVFHKEGIMATMYALADWFTPAEVEAPTLETVSFHSRRGSGPLPIAEVPAVLFSEVMRDIDLAVSVAHAGGVDPEASLSTVEMRAVLIRELLPLLKLDNVRIAGSHAMIAGALGEYTVHLGSGVAHRMASGALHIVPVHSQHRGRLFLPFVDDDPRTAEIVSKVLLLAEDRKLKDPTIVRQLTGK